MQSDVICIVKLRCSSYTKIIIICNESTKASNKLSYFCNFGLQNDQNSTTEKSKTQQKNYKFNVLTEAQ